MVWRTCLHLAGSTTSSWTSLRTEEGRPSGKQWHAVSRSFNSMRWDRENLLLSFILPHPPTMQLVSGGMFSSGKGRHTGWTRLPVVISATVRVNRPLWQTLIIAILNEAYRTECADPTQSGLCHSSKAKRNGTSRARRWPWCEGPALLRRGLSGQTLPPPLSHRWETPFTKEEKEILTSAEKRIWHMQRKGWATVWTSILWEWCKAVCSCHYPAVSQDGPATEVRAPGLQGNLDMGDKILIYSHRFYN